MGNKSEMNHRKSLKVAGDPPAFESFLSIKMTYLTIYMCHELESLGFLYSNNLYSENIVRYRYKYTFAFFLLDLLLRTINMIHTAKSSIISKLRSN